MKKYQEKYDSTAQECLDYHPIQHLKNFSLTDMEIAEDAGCDTCVHYRNGKCKIHKSK